jgi:regulator of protease activity HflC (stomatin/prohibitin superfamily)
MGESFSFTDVDTEQTMSQITPHYSQLPSRAGVARIPNPLPAVIMIGFVVGGLAVFGSQFPSLSAIVGMAGAVVLGSLFGSMVKIAAQWEKALLFRLGRFRAIKGPGPFFMIPLFDSVRFVDTRIMTLDIPRRQAITKDNVPVMLDGVIFMRVSDPSQAVVRVRNYEHAIQQYSQTALRDIVGAMTLDQILADRELVGKKIEEMVEAEIDGWGVDLAAIRIQDIEMPEDLKRVMARQASAEREKRATITKAEGDAEAAENLSRAARLMAASPGALQLRTLQTLDGLGASNANTIIMPIPMELMEALKAVPKLVEQKTDA